MPMNSVLDQVLTRLAKLIHVLDVQIKLIVLQDRDKQLIPLWNRLDKECLL